LDAGLDEGCRGRRDKCRERARVVKGSARIAR
jgi:hypothetical protein